MIVEKIRSFISSWREAKKILKESEKIYRHYENSLHKIVAARLFLERVYNILPVNQRRDYVQKTIDLLKLGIVYEYSSDGSTIIRRLTEVNYMDNLLNFVEDLECRLSNMKHALKNRDYPKVFKEKEIFDKHIDEFTSLLKKL